MIFWHVYTHKDDLYVEGQGVFHPNAPKFDQILNNINELMERVNDIIAEQFWSTMECYSTAKINV